MSPLRVVLLGSIVASTGCSAVASVIGVDANPLSIDVAPAVFVDDTTLAEAISTHMGGRREVVTATWSSSDPSVISVDGSGRIVGHIENRSATISAKYQGQTATAVVNVRADDARLGYALADQPTEAGPYAPDAAYRYNSSGGAIQVTRSAVGVYSVRFSGLGRETGSRDNVQVSAYGTAAAYCKPGPIWTSEGADMVVPVRCFSVGNGIVLADSRFTVLLLGARAFGRTAPVAFAVGFADSGAVTLDSTATARNSSGGHVFYGRVSEGEYALQFPGFVRSTGPGPIDYQVTAGGQGGRRCRIIAVDPSADGVGIECVTAGGNPVGDSPFSFLAFVRGRANTRYGFAWANNAASTANYAPDAAYALNSSGGAITAHRTGTGTYQVVFSGLGRPSGATEDVQLSSAWEDGPSQLCSITSWGTSGVNDLAVNVACFNTAGAPGNGRFSLLVVQ